MKRAKLVKSVIPKLNRASSIYPIVKSFPLSSLRNVEIRSINRRSNLINDESRQVVRVINVGIIIASSKLFIHL